MIPTRRVLHLIDSLDEYSAAATLGELIPRLSAAGWGAQLVALRSTQRGLGRLRAAGIDVHVLNRRWQFDPIAAGRLRALGRTAEADLLHCWDLSSLAYVWAAWLGAAEPPVVLRLDADQTLSRGASGAMKLLRNRVAKILVASTSADVRRGIGDLPKHKIVCWPPGIPPASESQLARQQLLHACRFPPDARLLAVAGKLNRANPLAEAIWRFELVRILHPNARLLVFGDGEDRWRLERFTRLASDAQCVKFLGYRDDFLQWLPHVDVFWSGRDASGVPRAMLEAMAAAAAVVTSDAPSTRGLLTHGVDGMIAEANRRSQFARHTDQLLRDRPLAIRIGAAAAATVAKKFSLDRASEICTGAYEEALGRPNVRTTPLDPR